MKGWSKILGLGCTNFVFGMFGHVSEFRRLLDVSTFDMK